MNQHPISQIILATRNHQNSNIRDFATALGVSANTISQWEHSIAEPDPSRLANWAKDERAWVQALALDIMTARYRAQLIALLPTPTT